MTRPQIPLFAIAGALVASVGVPASGAPVQTLRFDLTPTPLAVFNLELVQDFLMPTTQQIEVVSSRINLNFDTETSFGSFDAANFGLLLNPPVLDPSSPTGLAYEIFSGADFGWSGSGQFTYYEEFDRLNGTSVAPLPGSTGLLYAIQYFNALRLQDEGDLSPMGGVLTDSWVEVDFRAVPTPGAGAPLAMCGLLALRRRRRH